MPYRSQLHLNLFSSTLPPSLSPGLHPYLVSQKRKHRMTTDYTVCKSEGPGYATSACAWSNPGNPVPFKLFLPANHPDLTALFTGCCSLTTRALVPSYPPFIIVPRVNQCTITWDCSTSPVDLLRYGTSSNLPAGCPHPLRRNLQVPVDRQQPSPKPKQSSWSLNSRPLRHHHHLLPLIEHTRLPPPKTP